MLELNKIYCGDCLDFLTQIDSESVSMVLTDPPYGIGKSIVGDEKFKVGSNSPEEKLYWSFLTKVYSELYRVLKSSRHLVFTCGESLTWPMRHFPEQFGFVYRHFAPIVDTTKLAGSHPGMWSSAWEGTFDFTKGGWSKLNLGRGRGTSDFFVITEHERRKSHKILHPTVKPEAWWMTLVKWCTQENELVLDPFLGSGTTALVCQNLKRRFIGIEIDPKFVDLAKVRLSPEMFNFDQAAE